MPTCTIKIHVAHCTPRAHCIASSASAWMHVADIHHERGAFGDGANGQLRDESQGPTKGFDGGPVLGDRRPYLHTGRDKGIEKLRGDAIATCLSLSAEMLSTILTWSR